MTVEAKPYLTEPTVIVTVNDNPYNSIRLNRTEAYELVNALVEVLRTLPKVCTHEDA